MGNYTSQARIEAKFGEVSVRQAATPKGADSQTGTDPNRVEDAIAEVEARADGILKAAGIAVPVTDPRVPVNLREPVERLVIMQLRRNSSGGVSMSESFKTEEAELWAMVQAFASGTEVLDGQDATIVPGRVLTNNDDGRVQDWGEYKRDALGNVVNNDGTMKPNLEKIL